MQIQKKKIIHQFLERKKDIQTTTQNKEQRMIHKA